MQKKQNLDTFSEAGRTKETTSRNANSANVKKKVKL
jgi:hypothetical protein